METSSTLQVVWYVLMGVLLAGYSLLDGFDLGVGILAPLLGSKEEERAALYRAIGPFWDGNEVWLLTAGGALFAAFPAAYATVFSGFYLALMLVLFALILRAVSLEFRAHDPKRSKLWETTFAAGSLMPALLFGVALGNVVQGIPLKENGDFAGTFFTLLRPFPLAMGLLGLSVFMLHGSAYAALKVSGEVQARARRAARRIWPAVVGLFFATLILSILALERPGQRPLAWILGGLAALSLGLLNRALRKERDAAGFLFSSLTILCLWGVVGTIHFPNLVKAAGPDALNLTLASASSSRLTLKVMLIIALVGMPLVLLYTAWSYRVFKGKVRPDEPGY